MLNRNSENKTTGRTDNEVPMEIDQQKEKSPVLKPSSPFKVPLNLPAPKTFEPYKEVKLPAKLKQ